MAMSVVKAPLAPRAMADNDAAVTSPRFTLDEAHRAAAVHDLLVYGLVGGDFGWEWEGLSRATMRTRVGGNVEQLMGSENGKGKTKIVSAHKWVTEAVDALLEMHDEAGPSETDVCWEWTIRNIGATFRRLASTRSFHLSTIPETNPDDSASSSTTTQRHRPVVRALKPVKLGRKKTYKTLDSLDTVVIELRGHSYEELVESGLDGRKLVRTNEDGTWKLMLAPGSLMRRGCHTCFWTSGGDDNVPSFVFSTRLDWHLEKGQEVFTQAGLALPLDQCEHPEHRKNRTIWPEEDASAQHIEETEQLLVNCRGAQIEIDQYRSRTRQAGTNSIFSSNSTPETQPSMSPNSSPLEAFRPGGSSPLTSPTESPAQEPPINRRELSHTPSLAAFPSTQQHPIATITTTANTVVGDSTLSSPLTQTSDISTRTRSPVSPCSPETPHTPIPIFTYDTPPQQMISTPVKDPKAMLSSNSQSYDSIPLSNGPGQHDAGDAMGGTESLGFDDKGAAVGGLTDPMEMLGSPWMMVDGPDLGMNGEMDSQEQMCKAATGSTTAQPREGLGPPVGNDSEEDMDLDEFLEFSSPTQAAANGPAHGSSPGSPQATSGVVDTSGQSGLRNAAAGHISDGDKTDELEAATGQRIGEELGEGVEDGVESPPTAVTDSIGKLCPNAKREDDLDRSPRADIPDQAMLPDPRPETLDKTPDPLETNLPTPTDSESGDPTRSADLRSRWHRTHSDPDSDPESEEDQDALEVAAFPERPSTNELDDELLDELLEDVEMDEASRACREEAIEEVNHDFSAEQQREQGQEEAGRESAEDDDGDNAMGSRDVQAPRAQDFHAQDEGQSSGPSRRMIIGEPSQVGIPFTPSPSIRSDDSPRPSNARKTSRGAHRQGSSKTRPGQYPIHGRGRPYKAAVDRAVITALKRSCLREQSATASERTRRAEEVKRREEAELLVTHLEHEREGWERERAMLIGEIKRLRGGS